MLRVFKSRYEFEKDIALRKSETERKKLFDEKITSALKLMDDLDWDERARFADVIDGYVKHRQMISLYIVE